MRLTRQSKHFRLATFLYVICLVEVCIVGIYLLIPRSSAGVPPRVTPVANLHIIKNVSVDYPTQNIPQIDGAIENYITAQKNDFQVKLHGQPDARSRLAITYQTLYESDRVLSLAFTRTEVSPDTPEVTVTSHMTFDLQDKKQLVLTDVLKADSGYQTKLPKLLHDYFKQTPQAAVTDSELVGLLNAQFDAQSDFSLTGNGLRLYLNPHQPDNKDGVVGIDIKKEVITDMLANAYGPKDATSTPSQQPAFAINERPQPGDMINPGQKMLALTFDDGPDGLTHGLLDTLNKYEAHATFFVLGQKVGSAHAVLQRMLREGNEIGNHSWSHPDLTTLSSDHLHQQVNDTQNVIRDATGGYTPRAMRPPYGSTNASIRDFLSSTGLTEALWNVDTDDWRDRNAQVVYDRIMARAADNRVILLHDVHPTSVEAAKRAIPELKARGFQLVTYSQLKQYRP